MKIFEQRLFVINALLDRLESLGVSGVTVGEVESEALGGSVIDVAGTDASFPNVDDHADYCSSFSLDLELAFECAVEARELSSDSPYSVAVLVLRVSHRVHRHWHRHCRHARCAPGGARRRARWPRGRRARASCPRARARRCRSRDEGLSTEAQGQGG